ncbi:transcriptional regulator [Bradyrhizobium sp. 164]|uniref:transcriptional regulator n=1 Tax=Bradyrhizobium sp. 164 TaxID=2782637 RepID=UPI001FF8893B|nr:transcriptional regulator [Bradyrhizobium sp. 164]
MTEAEKENRLDAVRRVRKRVLALEEKYPHLHGFGEFLDDFNKETERGAALAAAAFIDDLLQRILAAFLVNKASANKLLSRSNAPLSSFSARIAAVRALGLLSETECQECELIRKIRNEFAHQVKMSFDDKKIQGLCSSLTYRAKPYADVAVSTRGAFTTAAIALIVNLTNRPNHVARQKLTAKDWPR